MFQSAIVELWLPVFGDIKFVTSTIFDIGVYVVVVGLALDVLRSLGAEIDEHFEEQPETTEEGSAEDQDSGGIPAGVPSGSADGSADAETTAKGRT